ncbi:hypothetical protein ACFL6C_00190 [Myxococcota bacterium]
MRRWALLLLFSIVPGGASATTVVALPEAQLVRHSDMIVLGTVIQVHTVVHAGGQVGTQAHVQVHRALRGASPNQVIILEVPGGKLKNGLVAHTPGSPALKGGDMVFGFLEQSGEVLRPLALSYGLLRVRTDARGNYRVFRETDGLMMLNPSGGTVDPSTVSIRDQPLDELIARISRTLKEVDLPPPGMVKP